MGLNWMQQYAATEFVELVDEGRMDRREALRRLAQVCGGSAAAVAFLAACSSDDGSSAARRSSTSSSSGPRAATTPPTAGGAGQVLSVAADDPDVDAEAVEFPGPDGTMQGYLAVPADGRNAPGIVVIHEIFGLNDHIRDVARRLAKVGYLALAPDLASRTGGTDATDNVPAVLTGGPVEDRVADLAAAADFLEEQPGYDGHLGVVGFCFGGGMTLSFAAGDGRVLAAVPYYGPTPQPASVMNGTDAAILAHYGETDERVNAGIADLEAARAGGTFSKHVWPGVGHAFNNDTGGAYDESAAVGAWTETLDWFDRHLG
jgi:carboxymethylenebutenolidase